jgi:dihydroorotate dehydrogenase
MGTDYSGLHRLDTRCFRFAWPPGWVWSAMLGLGMIVSGVAAAIVAVTRVVLPYDEAFVGMSRAELAALNPQLLPFMTHDRVSLAGVMVSIGVIYGGLALGPIRAGQIWAWKTLMISGTVGFLSFFLFLGFGYFDPLHALLALVLLPCFLLGLRSPAVAPAAVERPVWLDLRTRRLGLFGRVLFLAIGMGLIGAGATIAMLGITSVFVPSDLAFMRTTPDWLHEANPRLIPLVAHDRAGFGGALVSNGLAVLLIARWGFRAGNRSLWWMLLAAGLTGFLATLVIHIVVGYTDRLHLLPAVAGFVAYLFALLLSYPYLHGQRARLIGSA